MTETPAPQAPLSVETDLEITIDGTRADIRSTGDRLFVEFQSLGGAIRAARDVPGARMDEIAALLDATDLTVEVRSRDRTIVAIGADAPAGPLSRWVGTAPAQVRAAGLVAAVGQEVGAGIRVLRDLFG
ncbi:hypothetical protein [Salinibaculum salinum]|uniref:hypothetical protein n=1 Tax=Salinibaculum salinum TaxID=3131996 RepID=UPI0030EF5CAC